MRAVILFLLGLAIASAARAGTHEPLPPAAAAVAKARFPGLRVLAHAEGALHAAGADDIVLLLGRGGERGARIVSVLWGDGHGGFRFADASGDIDAACPGCDVSARVRGRELEVSTGEAREDGATVRTWCFAYRGTRGDVLRLVRVRTEQVARGGRLDETASADLLTGQKLDVREDGLGPRRRRSEHASRVALRQPILFDQFAFSFGRDAPETRLAFAGE